MKKIKKAINVCLLKIKKWFNKNDAILYMFIMTLIGITAKYCEGNNLKWLIALVCAFFCFVILFAVSKEIRKINNENYRIKGRYTHKDLDGNIYVDEDKIKQAIIYLSLLEDSLYE